MKFLPLLIFLCACHPPDPEVEQVRQVDERLTRLEQNIQSVKLRRYYEDINRIALSDAIQTYEQAKDVIE